MQRDPERFAEIDIAKTPFEAQVVVSVLRSAGIPAYLDGNLLQDEFAISQALRNNLGVMISVPVDRLEDAHRALDEARGNDPVAGSESQMSTPSSSIVAPPASAGTPARPSRFWTVERILIALLAISTAWLFNFWWDARGRMIADPNFDVEWIPDGNMTFWKGTKTPAARYFDRDRNGTWEEIESFTKQGEKIMASYDGDQDGVYERVDLFRPGGEKVAEQRDRDGDGMVDEFRHLLPDGFISLWFDKTGDGIFEWREILDPEGNRLFAEEDRGREGFLRR